MVYLHLYVHIYINMYMYMYLYMHAPVAHCAITRAYVPVAHSPVATILV